MKKIAIILLIMLFVAPLHAYEIGIEAPDDVGEIPDDAIITESGLGYKILKEADSNEHPKPFSKVTVHYSGWTIDGKLFDSSVQRNQPITFPLLQVIDGWREGLVLMKKGEIRRLWIPSELAYNNKPGTPQGMLVFDVELIDIPPQKIKFQ